MATVGLNRGESPGFGIICSPDKDLAQVVSGTRVVCWDRRRGIISDEAAVLAKFGVRPGSIPDWLALVGDAADGPPGLPGWGPKAATEDCTTPGLRLFACPAETCCARRSSPYMLWLDGV